MSIFSKIFKLFQSESSEQKRSKRLEIMHLARDCGYELLMVNEPTNMLRFTNGREQINVYVGTMTVTTELKHPEKGKTQLHRRNVSMELLEKIFKNPRQHTGRGYYTNYKKRT